MPDAVTEEVNAILDEDATGLPADEREQVAFNEVLVYLRSSFLALAHLKVEAMRPEIWHLMTLLCKTGRIATMVRDGYDISELTRKEESREW